MDKIPASITLDQLAEKIIDTLHSYSYLEGDFVIDIPTISDEPQYEELKDAVKRLILERRNGLLNELGNIDVSPKD